jgi:hypothetical protein
MLVIPFLATLKPPVIPAHIRGVTPPESPRRIIGTAGFDSALYIERQLLPEKEILGRQLRPRLKAERHEPEGVDQQADGGPPPDRRGRVFPHAKACHKVAMPWNFHSTLKSREFRLGPNNCGMGRLFGAMLQRIWALPVPASSPPTAGLSPG